MAPDYFVVRGVSDHQRRSYKIWEEGKGPELVVEFTSLKSHIKDLGDNPAIYERLGVLEYFVFDPHAVDFTPPFRGFRLEDGALMPMVPTEQSDGTVVYTTDVLGLEFHGLGQSLRLMNPDTGETLPLPDELRKTLRVESARAEKAEARAEAAKAELARLREEFGRKPGE